MCSHRSCAALLARDGYYGAIVSLPRANKVFSAAALFQSRRWVGGQCREWCAQNVHLMCERSGKNY